MIKAVIFDLDDTLYDEIDYCKSGFAAVAEFLHNANPSIHEQALFNNLCNQFQQKDRTRVFNAALEAFEISYDSELIKKLVGVYRDHRPNITLPDDSKNVLEQLKPKYPLGLLTDGYMPAQRLKVEALGIADYFSCIIYTEDLGRQCWKPSPVGFEKILDKLAVKPGHAVYVADNIAKDFIAPRHLGMATIQVLRPRRVHNCLAVEPAGKPQLIIEGLRQLPQLLRKL